MSRVIRLDEKSGQELEGRLRAEGFEFGDLAYARFQARGPSVVVSFYESGKLVVQGKGEADFCERFLEIDLKAEAPRLLEGAAIGTDEAGKGDTFGGMAVAGVLVPAGAEDDLVKAGVADSKSIGDRRIKVLAPWIKDRFEHKIFALGPAEYNAKHAEVGGNVNRLLTELHGNIAIALFPKLTGSRVVVDRFGANLPVTKRLRDELPEARGVETWSVSEEYEPGLEHGRGCDGHGSGLEHKSGTRQLPRCAGEVWVGQGSGGSVPTEKDEQQAGDCGGTRAR